MDQRYSLFPIIFPRHYEMFKRQETQFWTTEEIDLSQDPEDWKKMHPTLQKIYKRVFGLFAILDTLVKRNVDEIETSLPNYYLEADAFYKAQNYIETIHAETYGTIVESILPTEEERNEAYNCHKHFKTIENLTNVVTRWYSSDCSIQEKLIANGCAEQIIFSPLFCFIFWLKKKNILPGVRFANELISRDEALHCDMSIIMYNEFPPLPHSRIYEIVSEFVNAIVAFTYEILDIDPSFSSITEELTPANMTSYIQFVADFYLKNLSLPPLYSSSNPFEFMDLCNLTTKSNFFEKRVAEYKLIDFNPKQNVSIDIELDI